MNKIKKGSSVVKKAGNKEIVFVVEKIFSEKRKKIAILKGLCIRIIEKVPVSELELVDRGYVNKYIEERNKILENTGIGVTIPEYGETYQLDDELRIVNRIKIKKTLTLKNEVLERLEKLKDELADMEVMVKEDMTDDELRDEDIFRINEKIKDLEQQILNVVEG